jgi:3-phytase
VLVCLLGTTTAVPGETVRFATFNVSLYGKSAGDVAKRLASGNDRQARSEAEIIQRIRPDVILLNEVDYDAAGELIDTFQQKYLALGQNYSQSPDGPAEPIEYKFRYYAPCNTGVASGHDLDRNGRVVTEIGSVEYGGDCWGFGQYPGQYGMVILSKYPIQADAIRTFRNFRWQDMPGALLPDDLETREAQDWYNSETLHQFPLSSKSHWDVPIQIGEHTIHVLASHPTPPTFDGPEDRNGCRNHDEIRFWVDYIAGDDIGKSTAGYIYDDAGQKGGIKSGASFVIMGDLNGDPHDGQGTGGISKLLASPELAAYGAPESKGGVEQAKLQGGVNESHRGDPRHDTLDAADKDGPGNLRLDYVLPSKNLKVVASGVFWPQNKDTLFKLVGEFPFPSSDHRLVWVDVNW